MNGNHPLIIGLKKILEESSCHRCANRFKLVKADCREENIKAIIYCSACDELSNATFVLGD